MSRGNVDTEGVGDKNVVIVVTNSEGKEEDGSNGITKLQKPELSNSSMIKIVGIQDKRPTSQISLSKPLQFKTSFTTFEPDNKQNQNSIKDVSVYNSDMEVMKGGNIAVDMPSPYHIDTEVNSSKEAGVSNTVDIVTDGNIAAEKEEGGDTAEEVGDTVDEVGDTVDKEEGGDTEDKEEGGDTADKEEGGGTADKEEGGGTADKEEGRGTADKEEGGGTVDKEAGYDTMNKEEGDIMMDTEESDDGDSEMDVDIEQIKVEEEEILVCDLCSKQCYGHKELAKHKKQAHLDTKQYTCEECGVSVKGARAFYNHKRRHKKFQCPKCEKHLVINDRAAHIRKCKGVKDKIKKCEHEGCNFTTERPSNLKRHMESHREVFCDVVGCGKKFHGKKKLDAHKRKEHKPIFAPQVCPKQGPKKEPKLHKCEWCSFQTRFTTHHRVHLNSCAAKKRAEATGPDEPVSKDELGMLYSLTNKCSMTEFNIILDFFMKRFGHHFFEQGAKSAVSQYANSLDYLHGSEEMIFKVKFLIDPSNYVIKFCLKQLAFRTTQETRSRGSWHLLRTLWSLSRRSEGGGTSRRRSWYSQQTRAVGRLS